MDHTQAISMSTDNGCVQELVTRDKRTLSSRTFSTSVVINAAGHWAPSLAAQFGFSVESPPHISWAWNVLFDVCCETSTAGAVTARRPGAQTFFILPWRGQTLIGTGHAPSRENDDAESVPEELVARFVTQVDEAVPELSLTESRISQVMAGRLPVSSMSPIRLTSRPMIMDHGQDGAKGFYSLWGIKYTTARLVARRLIDRILKNHFY
jgi:glycerol-3-phosphate dehydrogenase